MLAPAHRTVVLCKWKTNGLSLYFLSKSFPVPQKYARPLFYFPPKAKGRVPAAPAANLFPDTHRAIEEKQFLPAAQWFHQRVQWE